MTTGGDRLDPSASARAIPRALNTRPRSMIRRVAQRNGAFGVPLYKRRKVNVRPSIFRSERFNHEADYSEASVFVNARSAFNRRIEPRLASIPRPPIDLGRIENHRSDRRAAA